MGLYYLFMQLNDEVFVINHITTALLTTKINNHISVMCYVTMHYTPTLPSDLPVRSFSGRLLGLH